MDLYFMPGSPPCRSVLLVAKALGLNLNKKFLDLMAGEHKKPEFLKINPQHSIPTLVDNGFTLWDSHAIVMYLADKYGKTDSLYPKDPQKRAVVNQRLIFDLDVFFRSLELYYYPMLFAKKPADPEKFQKIGDAFELLNTLLEGQKFAAGDNLTIADTAFLASLSSFEIAGYDFKKYTNVAKYYENLKKVVPGWAESWEYAQSFKRFFE